MVLKYSEDGYPYHEPPYTWMELRELEGRANAPPVAIYKGKPTDPPPPPSAGPQQPESAAPQRARSGRKKAPPAGE
jgi:hypothetical protein